MKNYNTPDLSLKYKVADWIERVVRYFKNISLPFLVILLMFTPVFA